MGMFDFLRESRTYLSNAARNYLRGKHAETIDACTEALARKPKIKQAYLFRYIANYRLGFYDAAILDATDLLSLYPPQSSVWLGAYINRSTSRLMRGNVQAALDDMNKLIAEGVNRKPMLILAYLLRSLAWLELDDKENAMLDIGYAEELTRNGRRVSNGVLSAIFFGRSAIYYAQGDTAKAAVAVDIANEKARRRKSRDRTAGYTARASIRNKAGDRAGALVDLDKAKQLAGSSPVALALCLSTQGEIEADQGNHIRAIASFDAAQKASPQQATIYRKRRKAYEALGNVEAANRDLEQLKLLAIDPPIPDPPRPQAAPTKPNRISTRTIVSGIVGALIGIILSVVVIMSIHSNLSCGCDNIDRANALYKQGDYAGAIIEYSTAIAIDPSMSVIFKVRGYAYIQTGDYDNAIADFKKALQLDPNDKDASYMRNFIDEYQ